MPRAFQPGAAAHALPLATAIASLALCASASASSSVTATISGITVATTGSVSVVDLVSVPIDHAILSVQDPDGLGDWTAAQTVWNTNPSDLAPLTPLDASISSTSATATGSVSASAITASVSTGDGGGMASARVGSNVRYELAPYSSVTVTWSAAVTGSNSGANAVPGTGDDLSASVWFTLGMPDATIELSDANGIVRYAGDNLTISFAKSLTTQALTFSTGETASEAIFSMDVYAFTRDSAGIVPEPATWALQLLGLGALGGLMTRRLRSRTKQATGTRLTVR